MPTAMDFDPGIIWPLLVDTLIDGYGIILERLISFYSPSTSNRGLRFEGTRESVGPPKVRQRTWYNNVYQEDTLYARVNVQHFGVAFEVISPSKLQQKYGVYFNVVNVDRKEARRLSFQERNNFLEYLLR